MTDVQCIQMIRRAVGWASASYRAQPFWRRAWGTPDRDYIEAMRCLRATLLEVSTPPGPVTQRPEVEEALAIGNRVFQSHLQQYPGAYDAIHRQEL